MQPVQPDKRPPSGSLQPSAGLASGGAQALRGPSPRASSAPAQRPDAAAQANKKAAAPSPLHCLVLTTSDSRTIATDRGGAYAVAALAHAGHHTGDRRIVVDDITAIRAAVLEAVERPLLDVLVVTGGTSLSLRDVTPEAVVPLFRKRLPGFGEALRRLAWDAHGPQAILTRAAAGVVARTLIFLLPGSPPLVELAMDALVVPVVAEACRQIRS